MTPAVQLLKRNKIPHEVIKFTTHAERDYGQEAADALQVSSAQVFKTLVVALDGNSVIAVVPVSHQLSMKQLANALGGKKASMADAKAISATGYIAGGVSPVGQKKLLPTVIDHSATAFDKVFVSGGKRGLEIAIAPADLVAVTKAKIAALTD